MPWHYSSERMIWRCYGACVDRGEARRLAHALRDELWSSASPELLARLADRGGMAAGLNPPDEIEDEELVELVWRALQSVELATAD
jgi:hypothetical protein